MAASAAEWLKVDDQLNTRSEMPDARHPLCSS